MNITFEGFGIWAGGLQGHEAFVEAQHNHFAGLAEATFAAPKPAAVPPKERRRAGLMINLAVEVAHQACEHANVDKSAIPSVFVSALGDTAITDYMCRKLAQPEKLLSPTKFHNSVHNAPSGYWTISAENRAPSSFVGGFQESFGAGLLEAASQALAYDTPVLLVAYDIANAAPFSDICPIEHTLGLAVVVSASTEASGAERKGAMHQPADLVLTSNNEPRLSEPRNDALRVLAQSNPMGGGLTLLEQLVQPAEGAVVCLPASPEMHLEVCFR